MSESQNSISQRDTALQNIDHLFERISNQSFFDDYLVPPYSVLKRTVDYIDESIPNRQPHVNLNTSNIAIVKLFERILGMYQAGQDRENLFEMLYATPELTTEINKKYAYLLEVNNVFDLDENYLPVNLDQSYIQRWLDNLCGIAKSVKHYSEEIQAANISRFFIVGDVGTGKTTFLSYVFSRNTKAMRRHGIIWIRVDLTKAHYQNQSLESSIEQHTAKVFRGFYHDELWPIHGEKISAEIRNRFYISGSTASTVSIDNALSDYLQPYDSTRTSPFHDIVQKGIKTWLEREYAMIYVFDGLDKLSSEDNYKEKVREVQTILGTEKPKHVYIFVMRNESQVDLVKSYIDQSEHESLASLRKESKIFLVLPPQLDEVMIRRLNLLMETWQNIIREKQDQIMPDTILDDAPKADKYEHILNSLTWLDKASVVAHYNIFLLYLYRALSFKDHVDAIDEWTAKKTYSCLKDLAGTNFRILLHILSLTFKRFIETIQLQNLYPEDISNVEIWLDKKKIQSSTLSAVAKTRIYFDGSNEKRQLFEILKKHYRVVETLTRNSISGRQPTNYAYIDGKISPIKAERFGERKYRTYLPNIFRSANAANILNEKALLLARTRILQMILALGHATAKEVIASLTEQFEYPSDHLVLDLQGLERDYLLLLRVNGWSDRSEKPECYYQLSRVGINILQNLVVDFNYLAMVSQDILVPAPLIRKFSNESKFSPHEKWVEWNLSRIPIVVNFIRLVQAIERQEMIYFAKNNQEDKFAHWEVGSRMQSNIKATIQRMVAAAIAQDVTIEIIDEILKYCDPLYDE